MGGNYEKSVFNQLMEFQEKLEAMQQEQKKDRKERKRLEKEVGSLCRENAGLREKVTGLEQKCQALEEENTALRKENRLLKDDNERMKRTLSNDSTNSSTPPSQEPPWKAPNSYNGRKPSRKKPGAQPGHKGRNLSKKEVEEKIREGVYEHRTETIGTPSGDYITRYRLDLAVRPVATEVRIYADSDGKYHVPSGLKAEVTYGETIQAMAAFLYSEGIVANDRICTFLNSISGDSLSISTGSVYGFCRKFAGMCSAETAAIEQGLLNAHEICTDATPVKTEGKQTYIRNFSTGDNVLYCSSEKKDLKTLEGFPVLKGFTGVFTHDHETALYHFGTGHAECNVHMARYLQKNTEETGNKWSNDMRCFLNGMDHARNVQIRLGKDHFDAEKLEGYRRRYDEIIARGEEQNKGTRGRVAKKEEKALLKRLKKYKRNHLLFLEDFQVHFSNNMSEKDLRICKGRQKMAGGFRTASGREMYCEIASFIETVKRRKLNIFQSIKDLMKGTPVIG